MSRTLGEAWLEIAARILEEGRESTFDDLPVLEVAHATLVAEHPDPDDELVAVHANPERLAWMRANFVDQVQWVIDRLTDDPTSRSATITTFEPTLDTTYIPCVSMLDFWIPSGALELVVYAHSIDFGSKGYGNLVQLADLQQRVAASLARPVGSLTFIVKSAHIYATEYEYMRGVLSVTA